MKSKPDYLPPEEEALDDLVSRLREAMDHLENHKLNVSRTPLEHLLGHTVKAAIGSLDLARAIAEEHRDEMRAEAVAALAASIRGDVEVRFDSHAHPKANPDLSDREFARGLEPEAAHAAVDF